MTLSHANNLLKLKLLNPRSPLAGGGEGGKGATYFWVEKQEELWEMCLCLLFFSAMHGNKIFV